MFSAFSREQLPAVRLVSWDQWHRYLDVRQQEAVLVIEATRLHLILGTLRGTRSSCRGARSCSAGGRGNRAVDEGVRGSGPGQPDLCIPAEDAMVLFTNGNPDAQHGEPAFNGSHRPRPVKGIALRSKAVLSDGRRHLLQRGRAPGALLVARAAIPRTHRGGDIQPFPLDEGNAGRLLSRLLIGRVRPSGRRDCLRAEHAHRNRPVPRAAEGLTA